jgi:hypothetical protein
VNCPVGKPALGELGVGELSVDEPTRTREEDIKSSIKKTNEDIEKARIDKTLILKLSAKFSFIRLKASVFVTFFNLLNANSKHRFSNSFKFFLIE